MAFGETVECLASEELLGKLPFEFDAVGTVSSASRFTAGTRPVRYGELSRFETMPSHPSAQACSNMAAPSPS